MGTFDRCEACHGQCDLALDAVADAVRRVGSVTGFIISSVGNVSPEMFAENEKNVSDLEESAVRSLTRAGCLLSDREIRLEVINRALGE